ncbi:hypothetical protein WA158_004566 [Blastocystis sp. Blastoise]
MMSMQDFNDDDYVLSTTKQFIWNDLPPKKSVFDSYFKQLEINNVEVTEIKADSLEIIKSFQDIYGYIVYMNEENADYVQQTEDEDLYDIKSRKKNQKDSPIFLSESTCNSCGTLAILSLLLNNPSLIEHNDLLHSIYSISYVLNVFDLTMNITENKTIQNINNSFFHDYNPTELMSIAEDMSDEIPHYFSVVQNHGNIYVIDSLKDGAEKLSEFEISPLNDTKMTSEMAEIGYQCIKKYIASLINTKDYMKDIHIFCQSKTETEELIKQQLINIQQDSDELELLNYDWFPLLNGLLESWTKDQMKKGLYIPIEKERQDYFLEEGVVPIIDILHLTTKGTIFDNDDEDDNDDDDDDDNDNDGFNLH